jgi:hypothetical protein
LFENIFCVFYFSVFFVSAIYVYSPAVIFFSVFCQVERYDVAKNRWEFVACMEERRYRPAVAAIGGKMYILGGEEGWDRYHGSIECYDPAIGRSSTGFY